MAKNTMGTKLPRKLEQKFASLPYISKVVLSLEMLIGRLEIFTFVIIFLPILLEKIVI